VDSVPFGWRNSRTTFTLQRCALYFGRRPHSRNTSRISRTVPAARCRPRASWRISLDGGLIGFVDVGLRSHADGCDPARLAGFIEGWFVDAAFRRRGIGAALIGAAENWACSQGCVEMASDTWIGHDESESAHLALGFEIVDRCIHFRKRL